LEKGGLPPPKRKKVKVGPNCNSTTTNPLNCVRGLSFTLLQDPPDPPPVMLRICRRATGTSVVGPREIPKERGGKEQEGDKKGPFKKHPQGPVFPNNALTQNTTPPGGPIPRGRA